MQCILRLHQRDSESNEGSKKISKETPNIFDQTLSLLIIDMSKVNL